MIIAAIAIAIATSFAAAAAKDPCASMRALVDKPSAEVAPLVQKAVDAREKACLEVVLGNALSREGHGSDAVKAFDAAAVEGAGGVGGMTTTALPEIAPFLELAKKRAIAPPLVDPAAGPSWAAPPSTPEEAADRVQQLLRKAKPKKAAQAALAAAAQFSPTSTSAPATTATPPTPPNEALEVAVVTALARADRVDEAIARASKLPQTSDAFVKVRAWALSKAQRFAEARDVYAQLAASTADPALKAEASFYAGFSAYEADDYEDAKSRLVAAADVMKGTPFEAMGRWYSALCDILRGKYDDAVPILDNLVKDLPSDKEALKHRYWLGRALMETKGRAGEGKRVLESVASTEPTDYYGLLARKRLGKKPIKGKRIPDDAVKKQAPADDVAGVGANARIVRLLWNLGLDDEARTLARTLGDDAPAIGLQQSVDDATFGWRRGAKFIPMPRTKGGALVDTPTWRVSYATPWRASVDASARKAGISSAFLYAIMRTESGFDPRAVSVAGAQGVIQLLPSAARGSCKLAGRPVDDAKRIFDPLVAIDLGAALLGAGKREFGSDALAAAVYNGAAENVTAWMKRHGALEPELFIERMPFRETRDYVKRVLAVSATYRALDGEPLAIEMPDKIPEPPATSTAFPMDE